MTPRLARCALAALALAGCARPAVKPGGAPDKPAVSALATEVQALLRAQDEALWKSWTQGTASSLPDTYRGHEALFSAAALKTVATAQEEATDERERRALTHLRVYLAGEHVSRGLADEAEALANLEAGLTFTALGQERRYRELHKLLATEPLAARRQQLWEAAGQVLERLGQAAQRKEARLAALIREAGYRSYPRFAEELRDATVERLAELAEELLSRSEPVYRQRMDALSRRVLGLPFEQVRRADLPRLFRSTGVDATFFKASLLPRAVATLRGMGLDPVQLPGLTLDVREGPRKSPMPVTVAVAIPRDVRVSFLPTGGARDQANLFHELGHGLAFAFTSERRFELTKLGNLAVGEAYAFLLEGLVEDPAWLTQQAGLAGEVLTQHLEAKRAHRLHLLRRAAGTLLYDLARHPAEAADRKALYRAHLSRAYGLSFSESDAARYQVEGEDFYQSADDLRGWLLAGQLEQQLRQRFGSHFWTRPEAGAFLRQLFASGNALSAEELSRAAGEKGLGVDALLRRFESP